MEHDGRLWIEIGQAARMARLKAVLIEEQARGGRFDLLDLGGKRYIPLSYANRLKRETADMRAIDHVTKIEQTPQVGKEHYQPRVGPYSAHLEKQQPLPMPIGRAGKGWLGQRDPD